MILHKGGEVYIPGHEQHSSALSYARAFLSKNVDIVQLYSSSIHKYNISMLSRLRDFVHQFLECGLIFATCKRNYVYFSKTVFQVQYVDFCSRGSISVTLLFK